MQADLNCIVYVTCFLDASGVSKLNFQILRYLKQKGFRVCIVTTNKDDPHFTWEYMFRNEFHYVFDISGHVSENKLNRFFQLLEEWKPSLLFNTHSRWLYRNAAKIRDKIPQIAIVDALHTREPYCIRGGYPDLCGNPAINKTIDASIVISKDIKNYMVSNYETDPCKLHVIQNGIDLTKFVVRSDQRRNFPRELGIDDAHPLIGFVGRLTYQKRPLLYLKIASQLTRLYPNAFFYLIGSGPMSTDIDRYLKQTSALKKRLVRIGRREDMECVFQATDLLLVPSLYEGAPLTIAEAIACGASVVASEVGAIKEYFDGLIGLVPLGDDEMENFIRYARNLLDGPRNDVNLHLLKEKFDLPTMATHYERLFRDVVGERPIGHCTNLLHIELPSR